MPLALVISSANKYGAKSNTSEPNPHDGKTLLLRNARHDASDIRCFATCNSHAMHGIEKERKDNGGNKRRKGEKRG